VMPMLEGTNSYVILHLLCNYYHILLGKPSRCSQNSNATATHYTTKVPTNTQIQKVDM